MQHQEAFVRGKPEEVMYVNYITPYEEAFAAKDPLHCVALTSLRDQ